VVRRLLSAHPEAEYWWSAGEVRPRTGIRKDYLHPVAGLLNFDEIVLRPTQAASLQLEVLLPVRGTGTAGQMAALVERESNITAS
jgi:hypothetical protein